MSGAIRWGAWEEALPVPHLAEHQSCASCGRPGPMQLRVGYVRQPASRVRKLVRGSDVARGVRPRARVVWLPAYWALTHMAFRCRGCREELVYGKEPGGDVVFVEALYRAPRHADLIMLPGRSGQTVRNQEDNAMSELPDPITLLLAVADGTDHLIGAYVDAEAAAAAAAAYNEQWSITPWETNWQYTEPVPLILQ